MPQEQAISFLSIFAENLNFMSKEIERKFLVKDSSFMAAATKRCRMSQGYLSITPEATVRVRIAGNKAFLTVKGRNSGSVRDEWEYGIPMADAEDMLKRCCATAIEKCRYYVPYHGHVWEIDVFGGRLSGLVLAEVELASEQEDVDNPAFAGREVTADTAYYNSVLSDPSRPLPPFS